VESHHKVYEKCTTAAPARPRAQIRTQLARVHEAATERRNPDRKCTYETRRTQPRGRAEGRKEGNRPLRHNFLVEHKDLIVVPNISMTRYWDLTRNHGANFTKHLGTILTTA